MEEALKDIEIDMKELFELAKERSIINVDFKTYVNLDKINVDTKDKLKQISDKINIFDHTIFFTYGSEPMNNLINLLCLKLYKININELLTVNEIYDKIKSSIYEMTVVSNIKEKKSFFSGISIQNQVLKAKEKCDDTSLKFANIAEKVSSNLVNLKTSLDIVRDIKEDLEKITKQFINYIVIGKIKINEFTNETLYKDIKNANDSKDELDIQKINTQNIMVKRIEHRVNKLQDLCTNAINLRTVVNRVYLKFNEYLNTTIIEDMAKYEEEYNRNFGINLDPSEKLILDMAQIKKSNEDIASIMESRIIKLIEDVKLLNNLLNELNIEKQKLNILLLDIQKDI